MNKNVKLDSALRELHGAVEALMQIVEGCRGKRWAADGQRLKDTEEWCRVYVARCNVNQVADQEEPSADAQKEGSQ